MTEIQDMRGCKARQVAGEIEYAGADGQMGASVGKVVPVDLAVRRDPVAVVVVEGLEREVRRLDGDPDAGTAAGPGEAQGIEDRVVVGGMITGEVENAL